MPSKKHPNEFDFRYEDKQLWIYRKAIRRLGEACYTSIKPFVLRRVKSHKFSEAKAFINRMPDCIEKSLAYALVTTEEEKYKKKEDARRRKKTKKYWKPIKSYQPRDWG